MLKIRFLFDTELNQKEFHQFCENHENLFELPYKGWRGSIELRGYGTLWIYTRETY